MSSFLIGSSRALAAGLGAIEVVAGVILTVFIAAIANAADRADPWGASFLVVLAITAILLPIFLTGAALRSQRPTIVYLCTAGLIAWPVAVIGGYLLNA